MSLIYPAGDEQVTPNIGLATWGMDEVLAENMILIDAAIGGPTGSIKINGSVVPATNFINSASVTFSVVGSNVSATAISGGTPGGSTGDIQYNNGGVFGGSLATITAAGALTLGTSPAGIPTLYVNNGATELGTTVGTLYTPLQAKLTVIADASVLTLPIEVHASTAQSVDMYVHSNSAFRSPVLNFFRTRGTQAAPTEPLSGDTIGAFFFSSGVSFNSGTGIALVAEENWGTTFGSSFSFTYTPVGQASGTIAFEVSGVDNAVRNYIPVGFAPMSGTTDVAISRLGAASLAIGNGSAGDFSGNLKVTTINLGSNCLLQEIPAGVTAGGLYLTSTAKYTTNPSGNPNVWIPLWTNAGATAGVANDSYLVLQAGNLAAHARCYIDFVDYDGSNKWLIGKNGQAGTTPNQYITYDVAADIHRIVMQSAADGSGGNTFIASAGAGAVIINGNDGISDNSCSGGFQVFSGGTAGSGARAVFIVSSTAISAIGIPFQADIEGYGFIGSSQFNIHLSASNSTIIATAGGSSPSHDILGINSTNGMAVNGNVFIGFTPTSDVTANVDTAISRGAANVLFLGDHGGTPNGTLRLANLQFSSDSNISRLGAGSLAIGNGAASNTTGNLSLNRITKAGADFAGQATVTAGNTTQAVTFSASYTGTGQPVITLTPTSDPLAAGLPVGYWVTYSGGAGAWTGFTVNIQTALAGNVTFNYIVVGVA